MFSVFGFLLIKVCKIFFVKWFCNGVLIGYVKYCLIMWINVLIILLFIWCVGNENVYLGLSIVKIGCIVGDEKVCFCDVFFLVIIELLLFLEFVVGKVNIVLIGKGLLNFVFLIRIFYGFLV